MFNKQHLTTQLLTLFLEIWRFSTVWRFFVLHNWQPCVLSKAKSLGTFTTLPSITKTAPEQVTIHMMKLFFRVASTADAGFHAVYLLKGWGAIKMLLPECMSLFQSSECFHPFYGGIIKMDFDDISLRRLKSDCICCTCYTERSFVWFTDMVWCDVMMKRNCNK